MEIERKKQEEILKRQRIIEDARKKEMEKRTKELLEQQQKSVLQPKKRETGFSFETIKDISNQQGLDSFKEEDIIKEPIKELERQEEDTLFFKDKVDIEKDLFDEFNNVTEYKLDLNEKDEEEIIEDKKLPKGSLDDYMKNFKETEFKESELSNLFDEDFFPNIPL